MGCFVCASENTVKSHIIPRALFHMMKRPGKQFVGSRAAGAEGFTFPQSGFLDDTIMCASHDAKLGMFDRYAAVFCRRFKEAMEAGHAVATIPNPKPELLVDFAGACVWRAAVSRTGHRPQRHLGPYAGRLQESLFGAAAFRPLLLIQRHALHDSRGELLNMGALPYPYKEEGIRFWRFIVGGLIFDLKLDARTPPPAMAMIAVNAATEITLFEDFPRDVRREPLIGDSLRRMSSGLRPEPRRRGDSC